MTPVSGLALGQAGRERLPTSQPLGSSSVKLRTCRAPLQSNPRIRQGRSLASSTSFADRSRRACAPAGRVWRWVAQADPAGNQSWAGDVVGGKLFLVMG